MSARKLTLGMIGSSTKENERRVAIHPAHFHLFDDETKRQVFVEKGYGERFRMRDAEIAPHVAGLLEREELFARCDAVMLFKPTSADFPHFRDGQVLWGAVHTVQNEDIVEVALEKKMTFIAMEDMYTYRPNGKRDVWLFHTQSELAGYCSVMHSLQLLGTKGWHDQPRRCAIISFGAAGRGAVHALRALDYHDISVYTMRPPGSVLCTIPTVQYGQYVRNPGNPPETMLRAPDGALSSFAAELSTCDIIVNCVYQNTDNPLMFVTNNQLGPFKKGTLIVDVSCDRAMGFEFARPTRFDDPMFDVGDGITYYAVDHSPSYLYNTASLEHSKPCWPYVGDIVAGPDAWSRNRTIGDAIEIRDGNILFEKILTFQDRAPEYPHAKR
ncbi:MAG: alanine dehydrogenase [bacterium]